MSRVVKDAEGFVAQTLMPEQQEKPDEWGNFVRKLDSAPDEEPPDSPEEIPENQQQETRDEESPLQEEEETPPPDKPKVPRRRSADRLRRKDDRNPIDEILTPAGKREQVPLQPPPAPEIDIRKISEENFQKGFDKGREQGFEEGRSTGLEEGAARVEQDYVSAARTLQAACEEMNHIRETILNNATGEIQDLALTIAEKILRHSLSEQKETLLLNIQEAIHKSVRSQEFVITVNPADYATVSAHSEEFIASVSGLENIIFQEDASVECGGCLIESENCTVDATITSQLRIIRDCVKES